MLKVIPLLATLVLPTMAISQSTEEVVNREVWYTFIDSYNQLDADAFMSVHTSNVVRVNRDGQSISTGEEYAEAMHANFERNKEQGVNRDIDLRFLERIYNDDSGFEVGIYRMRRAVGGQEQLFYGKFHVLLRRVSGTWKIAMDSDISNDGMIREEDFMKAAPLPDR